MPHTLHTFGARARNDLFNQRIANLAIFRADTHLDQFVMIERDLELRQNVVGETFAGNGDHGFQAVTKTTEMADA